MDEPMSADDEAGLQEAELLAAPRELEERRELLLLGAASEVSAAEWLAARLLAGPGVSLGLGTLSFAACALCLCGHGSIGDAALQQAYSEQAPRDAYYLAMVTFATAFTLNILSLLFEQDPSKKQLVLLACYVNMLAASSGFLSWAGMAPVVRDIWGGGLCLMRVMMWLHTTPAMVYLLGLISDFQPSRIRIAVLADMAMILTSLVAHLHSNVWISACMYVAAFSLFGFVIKEMWQMYDSPIVDAAGSNNSLCLKVLRFTSVGLWFTLPATFLIAKLGGVSLCTEEWLWTVADFLGKVTFSSSLLYGNFMTIEQRRQAAIREAEESNRMQVIEELQDLVNKKERFMSSISHELRTPLNGIIGLSESLLVGRVSEDPAAESLRTIKSSGLRLLGLINNVLDADSMRTGQLVLKCEQVNIAEVVQDVVHICTPLANHGVSIRNAMLSTLPAVKGDTGRIVQIVYNVISNSCKFTEQGHILVSASLHGDCMRVSVSDTGIGIPESRFEQIFQAFEQVDMSATRKYGGSGLGLNLVKQLVEAHGGTVTVQSVVGEGTTLAFTLPLWNEKREAAAAGHVAAAQAQPAQSAVPAVATALEGPVVRRNLRDTRSASFSSATSPTHAGQQAKSFSSSSALTRSALGVFASGSNAISAVSKTAGSDDGSAMSLLHHKASLGEPRSPMRSVECRTSIGGFASSAAAAQRPAAAAAAAPPQPQPAPAAEARRSAPLPDVICGRKRSKEKLVLSVDDDPVNQLVVQSLLNPEGYKVIQAMDGQEALAVLEESEELPDVILLDVMMPGMSGYEVCRRLRAMPSYRCVPIIMVSAKSKDENIVEGLAAGCNDYVVKPFGRRELLARIASHVSFRDEVLSSALDTVATVVVHDSAASVLGSDQQLQQLQRENGQLERQLEAVSDECERLQCQVDALGAAAVTSGVLLPGSNGGADTAGWEIASRLEAEKHMLERQLHEVSNECERLQDEVDAIRAELTAKAGGPATCNGDINGIDDAGSAAGHPDYGDLSPDCPVDGDLNAQVAALQAELHKALAQQKQVESQLEEAEEELIKVHQDKRSADIALRVARRQLAQAAGAARVLAAPGASFVDGEASVVSAAAAAVRARYYGERRLASGSMPTLRSGNGGVESPVVAATGTAGLYRGRGGSMPLTRVHVQPKPSWSYSSAALRLAGVGVGGVGDGASSSGAADAPLLRLWSSSRSSRSSAALSSLVQTQSLTQTPHQPAQPSLLGRRVSKTLSPSLSRGQLLTHVPLGLDASGASRLAELLRAAGLEQLTAKFVSEDITPRLLLHLDDDSLRELGVSSIGSRMRLRALAAAMEN